MTESTGPTDAPDRARRRLLRLGVVTAGLALPAVAWWRRAHAETDFEAFKQQHLTAFDRYETALREAFAEYRHLHEQAFAEYRRRLGEKWDDPPTTDTQRWVEYSADLATQRVVDFEANEIRLAILTPTPAEPQPTQRVVQELTEVLTETERTANERDPVTQAVERGLDRQTEVPVERAKPPADKPMLSELFDRPQPSPTEVRRQAEALVQAAKREPIRAKQDDAGGGWAERVTISLPTDRPLRKAKEYLPPVRRHAERAKVGADLVLALMHSESTFNPRARSGVPAYGLMQIVPQSAGMDATQALFGKARLLSPSYLYEAEKNIEVGTTYLNILYYRYLRAIGHEESRLYCTIAAYNTGAGNVAKAFTGGTNIRQAAEIINRQSPEQVYRRLVEHLPYEETRRYVPKVLSRLGIYNDEFMAAE